MKIETKLIFKTITINLFIAILLFNYLIDFNFEEFLKFIKSLFLNFLIGIIGLYYSGYLIGQNLYKFKKTNYKLTHGILSIFGVLILGTIIGSTVGFIQEGLPDDNQYQLSSELEDYYFKPIFWILLFGFIPTLISGIVLGNQLKKLKAVDILPKATIN